MKKFFATVLLAGALLAAGGSGGAEAQPRSFIVMRNTGTLSVTNCSVHIGATSLTVKKLLPDGGKTFAYDKPVPLQATARFRIKDGPVIERTVSLRGWKEYMPSATAVMRIYIDFRSDRGSIDISFMYLDSLKRMIDFRKAAAPPGARP